LAAKIEGATLAICATPVETLPSPPVNVRKAARIAVPDGIWKFA